MKFLPFIVQTPSDAEKKIHAVLLPDFSMNFQSSAKRAAYTRDLRVVAFSGNMFSTTR